MKPKITIMNLRRNKPTVEYDVIADRRSVLGNPYKGDRDKTCRMYYQYFYKRLIDDHPESSFKRELIRLAAILKQHGQLRLYCWCTPKQCHTEIIKEYLESVI